MILYYKNLQFKQLINDIAIDLCMEDIRKKCDWMVDLLL